MINIFDKINLQFLIRILDKKIKDKYFIELILNLFKTSGWNTELESINLNLHRLNIAGSNFKDPLAFANLPHTPLKYPQHGFIPCIDKQSMRPRINVKEGERVEPLGVPAENDRNRHRVRADKTTLPDQELQGFNFDLLSFTFNTITGHPLKFNSATKTKKMGEIYSDPFGPSNIKGIISPMILNIYLRELDLYVENLININKFGARTPAGVLKIPPAECSTPR